MISLGSISRGQSQQQQQQKAPPQQQPASPPGAPQTQSQQSEPPLSKSKISTEVKLVTVYAAVRDKHGKIIPNLNQSDFALQEDARPQSIKFFARESDLPLTLGLLVDTSLSQRRVLDQEKSASYSFFDHILREDKDKAFLIHFDREVELLRDLTASREKLRSGLEDLNTPSFTNTSGSGTPGGSGRGHSHGGGGTLLYDSIYLASNELMKKQQGRKAIVILTDGVDNGSKESLNTAIASAQRADTAVYSILFADEDAYGPAGRGGYGGRGGYPGGGMGRGGRYFQDRPDGKKVLERISKETGGQLFEVKKKLPIEQIYALIEEELRNQYSLAYTPDRPGDDSTYHLIHVTVNQKDLVVQAREGYYSAP
ncbi:MAG TPA: VWA domain-containing protein [Candidatus Acidoferrales bacterium]|nr:VWA domain-containing protein [Candidatus Acidoferrales bacterium]